MGKRAAGAVLGLGLLAAGCAAAGDGGATTVDGAPFDHLAQCGDAPYVAVFRGFTREGLATEGAGSSPSSDIYGIRPDGSVGRITTDLGSYEFGITADASTLIISPHARSTGPGRDDVFDEVVRLDLDSGRRTQLFAGPPVLEAVPSPDGARVALVAPEERIVPGVPAVADLAVLNARMPNGLARQQAGASLGKRDLVWSPDGRSLAYLADLPEFDTELRVRDMTTGDEQTIYSLDADDGSLQSLDWSMDGSRLLTLRSNISPDTGNDTSVLLEISLEEKTTLPVLDGATPGFVYSSADASAITVLDNRQDEPLTARTWTRGPDGTFTFASAAEFGSDVGLVGADMLSIPDCAMR